jgi:hypothetical protein
MTFQPHEHEGPRVVQVPDVPILADWGHAACTICAKPATEPARDITPQPHEDSAAYRSRITKAIGDINLPSTVQPREGLRGEALRQAWLNASYQAGAKEVPAVSVRALAIAISLAVVCWAIIGAGVWFVWRAF